MRTFKNITSQEVPVKVGDETLVFAPGEVKHVREDQASPMLGNGTFREVVVRAVGQTDLELGPPGPGPYVVRPDSPMAQAIKAGEDDLAKRSEAEAAKLAEGTDTEDKNASTADNRRAHPEKTNPARKTG